MKSYIKYLLSLIFVVLVCAGVANAAATWPNQPKLNAAATAVAGKPMTVTCYQDAAAWDKAVRTAFGERQDDFGTRTGANTDAFTRSGDNKTYFAPVICKALVYAQRVGPNKVSNLLYLGGGIAVIAHESIIAGGRESGATTDQLERNVEACARQDFALVVHTLYGVKYHTAEMRSLVSYALFWSNQLPYATGGTCS